MGVGEKIHKKVLKEFHEVGEKNAPKVLKRLLRSSNMAYFMGWVQKCTKSPEKFTAI